MILLTATTDSIEVVTSAAATLNVHASWMDYNGTTVTPGRTNTAITTATTTTVLAAPAASTQRNLKTLNIRNKHASLATDVTVQFNQNATVFELHKATLKAGEALEYIEGVGFFVLALTSKLDAKLRVASDVTNATTSFADVTGLTSPVEAGKHYCFESCLYHVENATTTGARFAVNGPTMTAMRIGIIDTVTESVSASVHAAGATATALDTSPDGATITGSVAVKPAILSGWVNPSAAGTFAVRCQSEVAVASGLIVKAGSWLRLWESDN